MNIKSKVIAVFIFTFSLFLSGCGPGQLLGATFTPTPTTTNTPTLTPTPTATATQTSTPTPTLTPTPTQIGGGAGRFVFALGKEEFAERFPDLEGDTNIFIANTDGTNLLAVTNRMEGYNTIQDISPDGTKILISSSASGTFGNLYSIDLNSLESEPVKLAKDLPEGAWRGAIAKWIDNTRLVFIGRGEAGFGIYSVNSDGSNQSNIYKYNSDGAGNKPVSILAISGTRIYWFSEVSVGANSPKKNYPWWSSMDGAEKEALAFEGKQIEFDRNVKPLVFSPDGTKIAWTERSWVGGDPRIYHNGKLYIASVSAMDEAKQMDLLLSAPEFIQWWSDNSGILVFDRFAVRMQDTWDLDTADDLFGLYTVSVPSLSVSNKHRSDVLDILASTDGGCRGRIKDFSPDGRQVLIYSSILANSKCYFGIINMLDMETMTFSKALPDFKIYGGQVYWLP